MGGLGGVTDGRREGRGTMRGRGEGDARGTWW